MESSPVPSSNARAGPQSTGSTFLQRAGYYALGLAIGLVMVGLLWQARHRAHQRQQHYQQMQQQQQQPGAPGQPAAPAPQPTSPR